MANGNGDCDEGCKIPVCLEFTSATATDEFKEQMSEIFTELFATLCSGMSNGDAVDG